MDSFLRKGVRPRKARAIFLGFCCLSWAVFAMSSCQREEPNAPVGPGPVSRKSNEPPPGTTPEENLYEQLRSGAFQLNAAAGSIEDSLDAARLFAKSMKKGSEPESAMQDVIEFLDSAGEGVSEYGDDPPPKEEVAKQFAALDDRRLKAIEAGNDSLHDLREGLGILESLSSSPDPKIAKGSTDVKALVAVAIDDLWGAIEALGGEPEATTEPLNP